MSVAEPIVSGISIDSSGIIPEAGMAGTEIESELVITGTVEIHLLSSAVWSTLYKLPAVVRSSDISALEPRETSSF